MFKIWGRKDGSNVIKVTWCIGELGVEYDRIDWGGEFGGNDDPDYRAINPNGLLPTLEEEDGFTISLILTRFISISTFGFQLKSEVRRKSPLPQRGLFHWSIFWRNIWVRMTILAGQS